MLARLFHADEQRCTAGSSTTLWTAGSPREWWTSLRDASAPHFRVRQPISAQTIVPRSSGGASIYFAAVSCLADAQQA